MRPDAIFRIYSMTKPITCVALMMLHEHGRFQLADPVSKFIPAFKNLKVYAGGTKNNMKLVDPVREVTIASTIQRMLQHVVAVGSDVEWLPGAATGVTLAIDEIAMSGA